MCVYVSVTTLAAVSLISTLELNYEQLYHGILFIFNSWILIKMLRSKVMPSFAYRDTPQALAVLQQRPFSSATMASKVGHTAKSRLNATWN